MTRQTWLLFACALIQCFSVVARVSPNLIGVNCSIGRLKLKVAVSLFLLPVAAGVGRASPGPSQSEASASSRPAAPGATVAAPEAPTADALVRPAPPRDAPRRSLAVRRRHSLAFALEFTPTTTTPTHGQPAGSAAKRNVTLATLITARAAQRNAARARHRDASALPVAPPNTNQSTPSRSLVQHDTHSRQRTSQRAKNSANHLVRCCACGSEWEQQVHHFNACTATRTSAASVPPTTRCSRAFTCSRFVFGGVVVVVAGAPRTHLFQCQCLGRASAERALDTQVDTI